VQRKLVIVLNIVFCLSWVFFASRIADSHVFADYFKIASFVIIAVFMLTLLAVMLQQQRFLKIMLFANRLFAIFLGIKLGLNVLFKPTAIGVLFIFFVVIPFIINSLLLEKLIQPIAGDQ